MNKPCFRFQPKVLCLWIRNGEYKFIGKWKIGHEFMKSLFCTDLPSKVRLTGNCFPIAKSPGKCNLMYVRSASSDRKFAGMVSQKGLTGTLLEYQNISWEPQGLTQGLRESHESSTDCSRTSDRKQRNYKGLMGWVSWKPMKIQWQHCERVSGSRGNIVALLGGISINVCVQSRI